MQQVLTPSPAHVQATTFKAEAAAALISWGTYSARWPKQLDNNIF